MGAAAAATSAGFPVFAIGAGRGEGARDVGRDEGRDGPRETAPVSRGDEAREEAFEETPEGAFCEAAGRGDGSREGLRDVLGRDPGLLEGRGDGLRDEPREGAFEGGRLGALPAAGRSIVVAAVGIIGGRLCRPPLLPARRPTTAALSKRSPLLPLLIVGADSVAASARCTRSLSFLLAAVASPCASAAVEEETVVAVEAAPI